MAKINNGRPVRIWLSVIILFICIAATAVAFLSRLDGFLPNADGAISLITAETFEAKGSGVPADMPVASSGLTASPPQKTAFEASDESTVWTTDTAVEIFRITYVNGEQVITVNSDNGDRLIAPGTENSYTFKLENTGASALDYTVEVDACFSPASIEIPIACRLKRYDGTWIVGGRDELESVSVMNNAEDKATLGTGRYTYYTLDWCWPFEGGNDEFDTYLGDLAVNEDLIFTVAIKTTASESRNPYDKSGIKNPKTGDSANLVLWLAPAAASFAMTVFLLLRMNKEKQRYGSEEKEN